MKFPKFVRKEFLAEHLQSVILDIVKMLRSKNFTRTVSFYKILINWKVWFRHVMVDEVLIWSLLCSFDYLITLYKATAVLFKLNFWPFLFFYKKKKKRGIKRKDCCKFIKVLKKYFLEFWTLNQHGIDKQRRYWMNWKS